MEAGTRLVDWLDDDPVDLLTVLQIIHLLHNELPATMQYKQRMQLAMLADKCDTAKLVRT